MLLRIFFITTAILLVVYFFRRRHHIESWRIIKNGIKTAWKECGFVRPKIKGTVELYQWVTCDDDDVCSDCRERAEWPPMDIADWMKEGLPRTPEAETTCGKNCRCELILVKRGKRGHPAFLN